MKNKSWIVLSLIALIAACSGDGCKLPVIPCGGKGQPACVKSGVATCNPGLLYHADSNMCRDDCGKSGEVCCRSSLSLDSGGSCLDGTSCDLKTFVCKPGGASKPAACVSGANPYVCVLPTGCAVNFGLSTTSLETAKSCLSTMGCEKVNAGSFEWWSVCHTTAGGLRRDGDYPAVSSADALKCAEATLGDDSKYTSGKCP